MLHRQDSVPSSGRIGTELVHLSSLIDFCPRQYVLAGNVVLPGDRPTGAHRVMWEMGLAAERHVVSSIVKDRQRQGVIARWTCPCGTHHYDGPYNDRVMNCERCGYPAHTFKQLTIENQTIGVTGTPDCSFYIKGGRLLIVEVKSMNKDDFDALTAPLPDHLFQAIGYHRLSALDGYNMYSCVQIIYVKKEFKWGDPYKEYSVMATTPETNVLLDDAFRSATELKAARANNTLPAKLGRCSSIGSPKARNCPMVARCFSSRE